MMRCLVLVGLVACTRATPSPAPAASSAPAAPAAAPEKLDKMQALEDARKLGMKQTIIVPHPVRCPTIAPARGDISKMTDRDLFVAIDAFLSEDMDVPEAAAILGPPALCNAGELPAYAEYYVAPKPSNLHAAALETRWGALIGIQLEFEKPVVVDIKALQKRYGSATRGPGPIDSLEAGSDDFSVKNAAFSAQLMFSHREHGDPPTARKVHRAILRRTSMLEVLPEAFKTENDVVRLVALALAPRAPDPVDFGGYLGVYAKPIDGKVTFEQVRTDRNVASATASVTSAGNVDSTRALDVTFITPIPIDAARFAKAIAPHEARGKVTTDLVGGALKHLVITRTD